MVLTLPVVDVLRKAYPASRISFLARTYTRDLLVDQEGIASVICYDDERLRAFGRMLSELRQLRFDLAVVAYPRFRIALLLWLAGVTIRLGTGYRWYSILFNKRVYEHRKTAEKHELDYNLSLLRHLGMEVPPSIRPALSISGRCVEAAEMERQRLQLSEDKPVVILHPGSGGSARDWSPENFCTLAARLSGIGFQVVVTGARGEESLVGRVTNGLDNVKTSVGRLGLKELAAFIKKVALFISNSTGPLHIAAAVGTPVIGFYPPIIACSPGRWGPV
ncbi:MAG TPA: glycosyltransferase family 9 protein, partial [Bacteroidota bacterium]|nr:glycosyltransferase family 9 protein [Bacteroidota bacterium]